jgi:endonuclease/exonuclease/phosphatase family metal-dependent hydrolase
LRHLHRYFDETKAVPTFPSGRPCLRAGSAVDASGSILRELKAHSSPLARIASDHLPLVATLDL